MKKLDILALVCLIGIAVAYAGVTLNSPIAFGDEGFYSSMGKWIAEHKDFPKYYPLWGTDHIRTASTRVPIGFANSSIFYILLGEAGIKIMMPVFSLIGALLLYIFFRRIRKPKLGFFASLTFLCLPAVVKYSVLNYPENQMMFYVIASFVFFYLLKEENNKKFAFLSGIFASLALLSDIVGAFILPVFFFFAVWEKFKNPKNYVLLIIGILILISPWLIRNLILYNSPCFTFISSDSCGTIFDFKGEGFKVHSSRPETSTGAGILKFGLAQYERFGFGMSGFIAVFGILLLLRNRDWRSALLLIWFVILLLSEVYLAKSNPRTEDLLRYTLFATPLIAILAAYFIDELRKVSRIEKTENYIFYLVIISIVAFSILSFSGTLYLRISPVAGVSKIVMGSLFLIFGMALIVMYSFSRKEKKLLLSLVLIISVSTVLFYGITEITNMYFVKHQLDPLVDACSWANKNLPENATLTMIYAHAGEYNCYRKIQAMQGIPDGDAIRLWVNETSYELLKKWGVNYLFIEGYTVVPDYAYHGEALPYKFVNFVENSKNFEKVFDNTDKFGRNGVKIYRVK